MHTDTIQKVTQYQKKTELLARISSALYWDQATAMPKEASSFRAEQMSILAKLVHERATSSEYGALIKDAKHYCDHLPAGSTESERKSSVEAKRLVALSHREFLDDTLLPADFVAEFSHCTALAEGVWETAKPSNDFGVFLPHLEKVIELSKQRARLLGAKTSLYDRMIDRFDRGVSTEVLDRLFTPLGEFLKNFIAPAVAAAQKNRSQSNAALAATPDIQEALSRKLAKELGFNPDRCVLQKSAHPFSTTLGPKDFRITTRFEEDDFLSSFFATVHEMGHSLYEQGLPEQHAGTVLGRAASSGVHESQSLFWENHVARSPSFLRRWHQEFAKAMPQTYNLSPSDLLRAVNQINPSFIRVSADEVTYCLHIIIRYQIEREIFEGGLPAKDIPHRWNALYKNYLGITPPTDTLGCLQDVHWSGGAFGLFPSYAFGHLFAAQLRESLENELGSMDSIADRCDWRAIRSWLGKKVHEKGSLLDPLELVLAASGKELGIESFTKYLSRKFEAIG